MPYPKIISVRHCLTFCDRFINVDDDINTGRFYNGTNRYANSLSGNRGVRIT